MDAAGDAIQFQIGKLVTATRVAAVARGFGSIRCQTSQARVLDTSAKSLRRVFGEAFEDHGVVERVVGQAPLRLEKQDRFQFSERPLGGPFGV